MVNFGIVGPVLTAVGLILSGFAAVAYRFLGTKKGKRWLNRGIDWAMERYYTEDPQTTRKAIIEALATLTITRREGVLTKEDDGFEGVLRIVREMNLHPDNFEDLEPEDEVVRLENVKRRKEEFDELQERGVVIGPTFYLDAVMEDGSRKIIAPIARLRDKRRHEKDNLWNKKKGQERRFRNRIEEGIRWSIIGIGAIGVGFSLLGIGLSLYSVL